MDLRNPQGHQAFHEVLAKAGFTDVSILERLGIKDFPSLRGSDVPILLSRTDSGSALDTLIRLFLVMVPCELGDFREAIHPMSIEDWAAAGLIAMSGKQVHAAVKLIPYADLLIAFDLPSMLSTEERQDFVMGIGASTLTLANLTVRKSCRLIMDLGTGCGFHALLASRHSERVIATDINPRAVGFAEFNAALNGLHNVECRQGDLFGPVEGNTFDLIVTNPPFVISPERTYSYRDGGMDADGLCRSIVQRAPEYLAEGGFCQILCNWAEHEGIDWKEGMESWFNGTGCDAWVIRSECRDIATYASTWIRHTEKNDPESFPKKFDTWMRYYEHLCISHISGGIIILRRRSSLRNWFRADEALDRMLGPCGESILNGFALKDFLEASSDADLLDAKLTVSQDARLERISSPEPDGWRDEHIRLYLCKGLAYSGTIDPVMANALIWCTGEKTMGEILQDLAAGIGAAPDSLAPAFNSIVRSFIAQGFLLPVKDRGSTE
jgi:hypothetical protein